jgi:hypothetical protein
MAHTDVQTPPHPIAVAYATRTGLAGSSLDRLSGFLWDITNAGIKPVWMTLGRSEFLARDGSTHRSVIGGDGTISGTVPAESHGLAFSGNSGDQFNFPNPLSTTGSRFALYAVASPTSLPLAAGQQLISGGPSSGAPCGPQLLLAAGAGAQATFRGGLGTSGMTVKFRSHAFTASAAGVYQLYGGQATGGHWQPINNLNRETALVESGTMWNAGTTWSLGHATNNGQKFVGGISFAMVTDGVMNAIQNNTIAHALVRYGIASLPCPAFLGFVGDSMTVSTAGGINSQRNRSSLIAAQLSSGWRGSMWDAQAVGGQPISAQETYYATMRTLFTPITTGKRYIVFWGGYNAISPFDFASLANAQALADRYIAMAADAASRGLSTVHWSRTREASVGDGSTQALNMDAFNDYYREQLALLSGTHIYYDHRLTYPGPAQGGAPGTHFDGPNRNAAFFGDDIHCSQLGIETLVADFLTRFPNPI